MQIGIDMVATATVEESIAHHGERYLNRVYTPAELRDCAGHPMRLAARFAAKEAVLKVLRGDEPIPWTAIGVRREPSGRPTLELTGPAAELATRRGVTGLELSITHAGGHAAAVVLAHS